MFGGYPGGSVVAEDEALSEGYAGTESCLDCHEDAGNAYKKGIHGNKADPRTPASKMGCETCHGPRAAHVEAGGSEEGQVVKPVDNAVCMDCHTKGKTALWTGSTHQMEGLSWVLGTYSQGGGTQQRPRNIVISAMAVLEMLNCTTETIKAIILMPKARR